jgi:archaellum component FlaC
MARKKVTIDGLARMVAGGFNSVESKMATKADMDNRFDKVDNRFDKVESRLDRVEALLTTDYKRRVEKLELEMKELKNALAM